MSVIDCLRVLNKSFDVGFSGGRMPVLDYWRVPVGASLWNTSCEAVSGEGLPSADCVLGYVGLVGWRGIEGDFRRVIQHSVKAAKRRNWFNRPVLCAIDFHDDLYYGGKCFGVVGCKTKLGTNKCFRVATLEVCEAGRRFTLAAMPVFKGTSMKGVLEYLVREARKHVKIKCVILDRGFYSIGVFKALWRLKLKYIVCAKKSGRMRKTVEGKARVEYTVENAKDSATVDLVVYRPDKERCWIYATNLNYKAKTIAFIYKKRWGIETGYKSKNKYNANTTSKNYSIRLFLILLGIILYNLWVLTNLLADSETIRKLKPKTQYKTQVTIFQFKRESIQELADYG